MCPTFHIRVVHFLDILNKKCIYTKYLCLLSQFPPPGLCNLGAQIRCVQNWYPEVQMDPKLLQRPLCGVFNKAVKTYAIKI